MWWKCYPSTVEFLTPVEEVLIYLLKLLCRNSCNFPRFFFLPPPPFGCNCCKFWPSNNSRRKNPQVLRSVERVGQIPLLITLSPKISDKACIDMCAVWTVAESCWQLSDSLKKVGPTIRALPAHTIPNFTQWSRSSWVRYGFRELQSRLFCMFLYPCKWNDASSENNVPCGSISPSTADSRNKMQKWTLLAGSCGCKECINVVWRTCEAGAPRT
jgi:hypothetical protein